MLFISFFKQLIIEFRSAFFSSLDKGLILRYADYYFQVSKYSLIFITNKVIFMYHFFSIRVTEISTFILLCPLINSLSLAEYPDDNTNNVFINCFNFNSIYINLPSINLILTGRRLLPFQSFSRTFICYQASTGFIVMQSIVYEQRAEVFSTNHVQGLH